MTNDILQLDTLDDNDDLVIIACAPRSGSTLLLRILNSHSKIAAPCEIPLVSFFDDNDAHQNRLRKKLSTICAYYSINFYTVTRNPVSLFEAIRKKEGKSVIIVKHPHQSIYLSKIVESLRPKIIYLTRDIKSTAMTSFYTKDRKRGLVRWAEIHHAINESLLGIPTNRILQIRYEDMVQASKETINSIADFIGVQFEPKMLDYGNQIHADDSMNLWDGNNAEQCGYHSGLSREEISTEILKEREVISDEVKATYANNNRLKYLNRYLGYDLETTNTSIRKIKALSYCFVFVCQGGSLEIKALLLAASLKRYLHCSYEIVVAVPSPPELWDKPSVITLSILEKMDVRIESIYNEINPNYPIGNKVSCLSIKTSADKTIFLDSDILCMRSFFHENRFHTPVSVRPAGNITWGRDAADWVNAYGLFGLEPPGKRIITTVTREETIPYYNAGVIFSDSDNQLGDIWIDTCRRIESDHTVRNKRPWLDQIALPIGLERLGLEVDLLEDSYNYPGGKKDGADDRPPLFLHYHRPLSILKHSAAVKLIGSIILEHPEILILMRTQSEWQCVLDGLDFHR